MLIELPVNKDFIKIVKNYIIITKMSHIADFMLQVSEA